MNIANRYECRFKCLYFADIHGRILLWRPKLPTVAKCFIPPEGDPQMGDEEFDDNYTQEGPYLVYCKKEIPAKNHISVRNKEGTFILLR